MNKRIIILIVVILLLISGGFSLWWWQTRPTPIEEFEFADFSPKSNFQIRQEGNRKIIENKKEGISFSVPGDWVLKEEILEGAYGFMLYSSDTEIGEREWVIKRGCKVLAAVNYINTNLPSLEEHLKRKFNNSKNIVNNTYERVKIDGHEAIRHYGEIPAFQMVGIGVYIPLNRRIYDLLLDTTFQDKQRCLKEFDNILETVSIEKRGLF
jgi:hypothetical protein